MLYVHILCICTATNQQIKNKMGNCKHIYFELAIVSLQFASLRPFSLTRQDLCICSYVHI